MTIRINHYFTSIFSNSLFNHPKRFSIGLRSGLWEGQGIWFGRLSSRNFLTTLDLCFGSLSMTTRQAFSWKTNAWDIKWVCKIHKNISEFILWLKIHNGNVPIEENAAHTLILGVCFTVGTSLFLPDLVHIFKLPRLSQIDISSKNVVWDHAFFGQACFLAHLIRYKRFFSLIIGILHGECFE